MASRITSRLRNGAREIGRNLLILTGALLALTLVADTASAQQCPNIKVVCSNRVAGDGSPLHCSATLEGPSSTNIIYRWNVSARAPIQTVSGKPDEVEVNMDGNSDRVVRVTVTINGLPEECEDSAYFDSFLAELGPQAQARANAAPANTTHTDAANDNAAPSTTATCSEIVTEGEAAYFSVNVDGVEPGATPIYSWAVSQGNIKKGQGTASIAVDTADLGGGILRATAHVGGFSSPLTVSCTTMVKRVPKAYRLDELAGINSDEENERLSRFALRLRIGLDERAYIIALGRRGQRAEEIRKRAERVRDYLINQFGVAPDRIMAVGIGFGRSDAVQLWVIQTGASLPRAEDSAAIRR